LANPAGVPALVLGVAEEGLMGMMAEALQMLGTRFALVVHCDGLDEISTASITKILELKNDRITEKQFNPEDLGLKLADIEDLKVSDAQTSAKIIKDVLSDKENGVPRDIILLNASAAIIAGGLADDFSSALELAEEAIHNGEALACLEKLIEVSNKS
jgi:anthranilate phosphoribosyltransferase